MILGDVFTGFFYIQNIKTATNNMTHLRHGPPNLMHKDGLFHRTVLGSRQLKTVWKRGGHFKPKKRKEKEILGW